MNTSETPSPQLWFHRLATQYVEAQILFHLNRVGVFQHLDGSEARSAADIAASLELDPELLETLLDYIAQVDDLLERDAFGRYALSPFGNAVIERFSRQTDVGRIVNMFDVRVGCYGPVWSALDRLLRREARYGEQVHRNGALASGAVHTLSGKLWPSLQSSIDAVGARWVAELGVSTALLEETAHADADIGLYGVDRDTHALSTARSRMGTTCAARVEWIAGDVTEPDAWAARIDGSSPGLFFSVHFHEFLAQPIPRIQQALRDLRSRFPDAYVLAFEQPRLDDEAREDADETLWLYAQSNVLIHHVIGNGKILPDEQWRDVFEGAGCRFESIRPVDYLGYNAYLFQL